LDVLLSEVKHGYWRNTVLHQKHIAHVLTNLMDRIIGIPRQRASNDKGIHHHQDILTTKPHVELHENYTLQVLRLTSKFDGIPSINSPTQSLAWLQVGDIAEATIGADEMLGKQVYCPGFNCHHLSC
jgi:hypothetical protein